MFAPPVRRFLQSGTGKVYIISACRLVCCCLRCLVEVATSFVCFLNRDETPDGAVVGTEIGSRDASDLFRTAGIQSIQVAREVIKAAGNGVNPQ